MYSDQGVGAGTVGEADIRYAKDKDISALKATSDCCEPGCFAEQWEDKDYRNAVHDDENMATLVADLNGFVACFAVIDISTSDIVIKRIASDPHLIRTRYGSQLIDDLKKRLTMRGFRRIVADVPEENLVAQQFFRSQGFKVPKPKRGGFVKVNDKTLYRFIFEFKDLFSGRF